MVVEMTFSILLNTVPHLSCMGFIPSIYAMQWARLHIVQLYYQSNFNHMDCCWNYCSNKFIGIKCLDINAFFFRLNYVDNYNKLYILSVARLAETPIKYRDWEFRRMVSMVRFEWYSFLRSNNYLTRKFVITCY